MKKYNFFSFALNYQKIHLKPKKKLQILSQIDKLSKSCGSINETFGQKSKTSSVCSSSTVFKGKAYPE